MPRHTVCKTSEIEVGLLKPVTIGRSPIVLARLPNGEIRAVGGYCPHQAAHLEYGCISGITNGDTPNELTYDHAGEVLRCPWHGFEYSLVSGDPLVPAPANTKGRLRFYEVAIEGDDVVVVM